jgi:hypothetical protein
MNWIDHVLTLMGIAAFLLGAVAFGVYFITMLELFSLVQEF